MNGSKLIIPSLGREPPPFCMIGRPPFDQRPALSGAQEARWRAVQRIGDQPVSNTRRPTRSRSRGPLRRLRAPSVHVAAGERDGRFLVSSESGVVRARPSVRLQYPIDRRPPDLKGLRDLGCAKALRLHRPHLGGVY
jgi:hypothetical protein